MKISCPSCSAKYSIADEKVVSRLAKIRCRKCGATIVIDGKVNPPSVTATSGGDAGDAPDAAEAAGSEYSIDFGEGDQRTLPLADILTAYNAGQITGETYVWSDGFSDWKPLSDVQEIVDALHSAASGTAGSKPQASASPWDAKPAATPQPSPERAAARPARGATSDLFGRIERAGSEEEVATSAPDAGGGSGTGARNESSVLFSLSALTSASKPSQTGSRSSNSGLNLGGANTASREDSGLIDLKALTAAAVKTESASTAMGGGGFGGPAMAPLATSPLGVAAPLGLGSPIGSGLGDAAPTKSKTGLFIAIGIVVAAVIVALALILRPAPPPVVVAPPAPPAPAPAPTPTPTPTLMAAPPPTGAASAEEPTAAKKPTTGGAIHRGGGTKKPPSGTTTPPAAGGDTPPPPPKKSNNCGCSPSDLNCNMRCRTKG